MTIWQAATVTLGCAALIGIGKFLAARVKEKWPQWRQRRIENTATRTVRGNVQIESASSDSGSPTRTPKAS